MTVAIVFVGVNLVLAGTYDASADLNTDNTLDVLDIVQLVNLILN